MRAACLRDGYKHVRLLHAEEWLLPLAMACDLESESSVSYQSPLALSRCVCDLSQICEIFLCAEPIIFDQNQ